MDPHRTRHRGNDQRRGGLHHATDLQRAAKSGGGCARARHQQALGFADARSCSIAPGRAEAFSLEPLTFDTLDRVIELHTELEFSGNTDPVALCLRSFRGS